MRENEPTVTVTIDTRKGREDIRISLFGVLDWSLDRFLQAISEASKWRGTVYGQTLQTRLRQEKQGVLGKTIEKECKNNPSDKRPLQERNKQGLDREPITETYNAEQEYEALRKRTGEKETGQLSSLGLVGVNRRVLTDSGDLAFKAEAGS